MPILSVLIPTKNRQKTAICAIREASKVGSSEDVEIIVQDCSDDSSLYQMIQEDGLEDRVVYQKEDRPVSMTENWNLGVVHVTGEYLIIIGDDDTVLPGIVEVAKWAKKCDYDAVKPKQYPFYGWPDLLDKELASKAIIREFTGQVDIVETAQALKEYSRTGDQYGALPMVYHGLVRQSVMQKLLVQTGQYFHGLSPDIYSAFAVAVNIPRYAYIDYPISMLGASVRSNSSRTKRSSEAYLHASEYNNYQYTPIAPNAWATYASNTDNLALAFLKNKRYDLLKYIDLEKVFARTIAAEPERFLMHLKKFIQASYYIDQKRSMPLSTLRVIAKVAAKRALMLGEKLQLINQPAPADSKLSFHSETIAEAIELQSSWIKEHGIPLPQSS